jgi:glutamate dehydrogenase
MTDYVDERGASAIAREFKEKLEATLKLAATEDAGKLGLFKALSAQFAAHTPYSWFASASPTQLFAWLSAFLDFMETRRGASAVRLLPVGQRGRVFLLTNTPDATYLFDSIQSVLSSSGLPFQVVAHPILKVRRRSGKIVELDSLAGKGPRESLIVIELVKVPEDPAAFELMVGSALEAVLQVHRHQPVLDRRLKEMERIAPPGSYRGFCHWLRRGNFLPFAYRCLQLARGDGRITAREVENSRAGLAPFPEEPDFQDTHVADALETVLRERLLRQNDVVVEAIDRPSPLLRAEPLVYLGFREPVAEGVWREHSFLGLFSEQSIDEPTASIPWLRARVEASLDTLAIPKGCHDYRKTVEILNTFPKVELFFMEPEVLLETIRSLTLLYRHGAVKVVAVRSQAMHGLTLLVIMPKDFYSDEKRPRMERYLGRHFLSPTVSTRIIHISAEYLSLHVSLRPNKEFVRLNTERLERGLTRICRPWQSTLRLLLDRTFGEGQGLILWRQYAESFSREYRSLIHPRFAVRDIVNLEKSLTSSGEIFDLWGPFDRHEPYFRLQFYSCRESYLNELMPLLENLNLNVIDEVDFAVRISRQPMFIKSFAVRAVAGADKLTSLRQQLLEALARLRTGEAENDYLNRLMVLTGLSWQEIDVFRGYRNYYFQLGSPFTKKRVAYALINNPQVALLLYRYFEGRFRPEPRWQDPLQREVEALSPIRQMLIEMLETVADINEDRILRILFNLIDSTVRTNYFQRRGRDANFFSFKISAIGIIDMPAPRPLFEIYVHSASMEGIHLRGGKVARGGIRWSDRPDDFRTEILSLMKTQMSKNALIVPVGSKGGFVVKTPYQGRDEGAALARAAYQTLMRGLLDLTDNRLGDKVARPPEVVSYDDEDPYLVVAADKGTAHLSDTANAISAEYGFWLGDAFASGGSRGYDHKALGITARGAWECVKRHFREIGQDIQREPFSVVGIGDMSGDVFGNGMLLSRQIRLLAAFDHRHIFLDPDPDPETSWQERKRLFELPRSSWEDYDQNLISEGGGVYPRDAKDIPLSEPLRRWLGVRHESMDGLGLVRLLLTAEADLLWNGGIGTYVKAGTEKHEDAGDRANDNVRVDAGQLRARVVGEGGNLGFTQRARIDYALAGGRINTDAVDNSGGVDCSDHEVNLKIFMQHLSEKGVVASLAERDQLLSEVTDEVCAAVLANNYGQSLCLSLDQLRCAEDVETYLDLADRLVAAGLLDRQGEFLPTAREVLARQGRAFFRPELAILMAYSKMQIYESLLDSDLPGSSWVSEYLQAYFPTAIRDRFAGYLQGHPLAREITATMITNALVNQAGSPFVQHLGRQFGATTARIVTVYLFFDRVVGGSELRRQLFALDNHLPAGQQYQLLLRLEEALSLFSSWALEHGLEVAPEPSKLAVLRDQLQMFINNMGGVLAEAEWRACQDFTRALVESGLPVEIAGIFSVLPLLEDFLPVVSLAAETGSDFYSVARTFHELREYLGIGRIVDQMEAVQVHDRWDRQTRQMLAGDFASLHLRLAGALLRESAGNLEAFFAGKRQKMQIYRAHAERMRGYAPVNFHPFVMLARALESLLE